MSELGTFLRARREAISPRDVGLSTTSRRRTPGLRREEVATLAGVSVDYLVRLEQGRDTNPSVSVISALADVLRLTPDERFHLKVLSARENYETFCPYSGAMERRVAPTVQALLDRLDPTPAFVVAPSSDALGWNPAWERLVAPLGLLESDPPNLTRYAFTHASARSVLPDWEQIADEYTSRLRASSTRWGHDDHLAALVAELLEHPEFERRWSAHVVADKQRGVKRIVHPDVGELRLAFEVLTLADDGDQRLVTWLPADNATAVALDRAVAVEAPVSPARLRVVGER